MGNISTFRKSQDLVAKNTCTHFLSCPARRFGGVRFVVKNREGEAFFDLPETIPASSPEDIKSSSFSPEKPRNLTIQQHHDTVVLSWYPSECATHYLLRFEGADGELIYKEIDENTATVTELYGCTQYNVFVTAVTCGMLSDEAFLDTIFTQPSASSVDNLDPNVFPSIDSVTVRWVAHREIDCVTKYAINLCKKDECEKTVKVEIDPVLNSFEFKSTEELEQCSDYRLIIKSLYEGKYLGQTDVLFSTAAPEPVAPEHFTVHLNVHTNTIDMSYDSVACATGYKVYQKLDDSEEDFYRETNNNSISLDSPDPCVKFSYRVSALINGEEGPKTKFFGDKVPPKNGAESKPNLTVDKKFNTNVIFTLQPPDVNRKCVLEEYHVKYDNKERKLFPPELEDGRIILNDIPGAAINRVIIEGRIKYLGFNSWSPWILIQNPNVVKVESSIPATTGAVAGIVAVFAFIASVVLYCVILCCILLIISGCIAKC